MGQRIEMSFLVDENGPLCVVKSFGVCVGKVTLESGVYTAYTILDDGTVLPLHGATTRDEALAEGLCEKLVCHYEARVRNTAASKNPGS